MRKKCFSYLTFIRVTLRVAITASSMTIGRGLTESSSSRARAVLTAELSAIRLAAIGAMLAISEVRSIVVAYMLVSRWSSVVLLET